MTFFFFFFCFSISRGGPGPLAPPTGHAPAFMIQASSSLNDSSETLDEITTRYVSSVNDLIDKRTNTPTNYNSKTSRTLV